MALSLALPAAGQRTFTVDLWPDGLPDTNGRDLVRPYDMKDNYKPRLTVFLPDSTKATGQAVLCIPGGGYTTVCYNAEGPVWAPYFLKRGIAIAVLIYRLPNGYTAVPATDAMEAMRILRRNATKWGYSPHKIGIMGHSAGGHLAATVATHAVGDARPDFQILLYPVITMGGTHTRYNLIGKDPLPGIADYYSLEKQVRPGQAPALILTADDDELVPTSNAVGYYLALNRAHVPASLHIWPSGRHGFSCHKSFPWHDEEIREIFSWLKSINQ